MAFDAGAIEARLTINKSAFNRDLDDAKAQVDRFTHDKHEVKVAAVFDNSSLSRARKSFSDLDNLISKDAMNRLRSSPQGSVLGALNALFSPHPVTGAPSPSQSAQGGLLGKIIQSPGGGGSAGPNNSRSQDIVSQVLGNTAGASNTTSTDRVRVIGMPVSGGNVSTNDRVNVTGLPTTGGTITTTDKVNVDNSGISQQAEQAGRSAADAADKGARDEARKNGSGWFKGALAGLPALVGGAVGGIFGGFGGGKSGSGGGGGGASGSFIKNIAGGAGANILGLSTKASGIIGLGGSALGALPALFGGALPLAVGAGGLGLAALGAKQLIGTQNQQGQSPTQGPLYNQAQAAGKALKSALTSAVAGLQGPLGALFSQIPALAKQITPVLKQVFSSTVGLIQPAVAGITDMLRMIGPGLSQAFAAAAPAIKPLLDGIGGLVSGLLPGLVTLLKAAQPAVAALASVFGMLGSDLGAMLKTFAPVLSQSSVIFKALFDVIGALLPAIGKLAAIFATALAPVFTTFAATIKDLLPFLNVFGNILASLAGAILGDLVSVFQAVATVLKGIAPALNQFGTVISGIFNLLENNGVFATLGDAVEALAKPLATLISALLRGLMPVLPPIISFIGQLSAILAAGLAQAIGALLPPLTELAIKVLATLPPVLHAVLPLLISLTKVFTGVFVAAVTDTASALAALITAIPQGLLNGLVDGFLGLYAAVKLFTGVMAILNVVMDANPFALIVIAVAALAVGFYTLWEKSALFRDIIKDIGVAFLQIGITVVKANQIIVNAFLDMVGTIIHAAADMFGWVPGIGPKLKGAAAAFDGFHNTVNNGFNDSIKTMQGWQNELTKTTQASQATVQQTAGAIAKAFDDQQTAAGNAQKGIASLTTAITQNGEFSQQAYAAQQALIGNLKAAGVNAATAQKDVDNYSDAVATNGAKSQQAQAARQQLVKDIVDADGNARQGNKDLSNYTTAVQQNGAQSDAARNARARLITDLENAGLNAKTATGLVNGLQSSINAMRGKAVTITANAAGIGDVKIVGKVGATVVGSGDVRFTMAQGGRIPGYGGGDIVPILAEPGEAVVDKQRTAMYAPVLKAMGVPGFTFGGLVGAVNSFPGLVASVDQQESGAVMQKVSTAALSGIDQAVQKAVQAAVAAAQAASGFGVPGGPAPKGPLQTYAKQLLAQYGWSGQWAQFNDVEMREAGWNVYATNPSSGAYGIPQALPPSKMASAGADWRTSGYTQLRWMMAYIKSTYGSPAAADAHEISQHWYGNGGVLTEPVIGYGVNSGDIYTLAEREAEVVTPMSRLAAAGANRQSGGAYGTQINVGSITLPEGATVGSAMAELAWRMRVENQRQQWGPLK